MIGFRGFGLALACVLTVGAAQAADPDTLVRQMHAATSAHLMDEMSPVQEAIARTQQSTVPAPASTMKTPYGVAVDVNGNVFVTNLFGGVNIYSPANKYKLASTITSGVSGPAAVAVSFVGNIYVANNSSTNVTVYDASHNQINTITDATLGNPESLYLDPDDTLWVLDAQGLLHAYLADGSALNSFNSGGSAVGPWGPYVTVWGIANSSGGWDEHAENRATALRNGSAFLGMGYSGTSKAGGECEDQYGQQYVSDLRGSSITIWQANGNSGIGRINTPAGPAGVAVDKKLNRLYVALPGLNQVYVYSTILPWKLLTIIH